MTANDEKYPPLSEEQQQYVLDSLDIMRGHVLKSFKPRDEEAYENLMAEGMLALTVAASRFDPDKGVKFYTYARWWVHKYLTEFIGRDHTIVPSWDKIRSGEPPEVTADVPLDADDEVRSILDLMGEEEEGYTEVENALFHEWAMTKVFPHYSTETIMAWQQWKASGPYGVNEFSEDTWANVFMLDDELGEGL